MHLGQNKSDTSSVLWSAAMTSPDSSSKGRGKIKKSEMIIYPEFESCVQCVEDQYWKDIFHQCARKKLPRGFAYQDYHLRHRQSGNTILLPDDQLSRTHAIMLFFQENGKLYSKRDQAVRRSQLEDSIVKQLTTASLDWKKVAISKNRRSAHVRDYVERRYTGFPQHIKNELITQISVGFDTKYITKDHVHFDKGQILYIEGIDINETGIYFSRSQPSRKVPPVVLPTETRAKEHQHYSNWCKYIEGMRKYLLVSSKPTYGTQPLTPSTTEESLSLHLSELSE